jgi:hypothetical protein
MLRLTTRLSRSTRLLFALLAGCMPASFDELVEQTGPATGCGLDGATRACSETYPDAGPSTDSAPMSSEPMPSQPPMLADAQSPKLPSDAAVGQPTIPPDSTAPKPPGELPDAATSANVDASTDTGAREAGAPICEDTLKDPLNCGICGFDCNAKGALASCAVGQCVRSCTAGLDDCNGDLVHGGLGDGCETRVDQSVNNCGACRKRCVAPADGFVTCEQQVCEAHTLEVSPGIAKPLRGSPSTTTGAAYAAPCFEGEVITGFNGVADDTVLSLVTHCARVRVTGSAAAPKVSLGPVRLGQQYGGYNLAFNPPAYDLSCPPSMVVTAVAGSTHYWEASSIYPSVKRLTITCSTIQIGASNKITFVPGPTFTAGTDSATPVDVYEDACASGVVSGFSGRHGAWLDSVVTHCSTLQFRDEAAGSVMQTPDQVAPTDDGTLTTTDTLI